MIGCGSPMSWERFDGEGERKGPLLRYRKGRREGEGFKEVEEAPLWRTRSDSSDLGFRLWVKQWKL